MFFRMFRARKFSRTLEGDVYDESEGQLSEARV